MAPSSGTSHGEQRARLLEVALDRLHEHGPEALRARDLTAEVGASTQALYTLFGGMPELIEAAVAEGFVRFARHIRAVPPTDDPVADHFAQGLAYTRWALAHQQLYRLMFGLTGGAFRQHAGLDTSLSNAHTALPEGQAALEVLLRSVGRMAEAGRISASVDVSSAARQFLSATHGYVLLEIAGAFGTPGSGLASMGELAVNLMVGLGDTREAAQQSLHAVLAGP